MTDETALAGLAPAMRPKAIAVLAYMRERGWQAFIAEGRRTWEQQREKVDQGYSKTMHSKHLTGRAIDVVDKRYLWEKTCPKRFWVDLCAAYIRAGLKPGASFEVPAVRWAKIRTLLGQGKFEDVESMKLGWDPAHGEMAD